MSLSRTIKNNTSLCYTLPLLSGWISWLEDRQQFGILGVHVAKNNTSLCYTLTPDTSAIHPSYPRPPVPMKPTLFTPPSVTAP